MNFSNFLDLATAVFAVAVIGFHISKYGLPKLRKAQKRELRSRHDRFVNLLFVLGAIASAAVWLEVFWNAPHVAAIGTTVILFCFAAVGFEVQERARKSAQKTKNLADEVARYKRVDEIERKEVIVEKKPVDEDKWDVLKEAEAEEQNKKDYLEAEKEWQTFSHNFDGQIKLAEHERALKVLAASLEKLSGGDPAKKLEFLEMLVRSEYRHTARKMPTDSEIRQIAEKQFQHLY